MMKHLKAATALALIFSVTATAYAETRLETIKRMYDQSTKRAEFSDFEALQTNGFIQCTCFYESKPDEPMNGIAVYLTREKNDGGPLFPPTLEKKVILLSRAGEPEKLFDIIHMSSNDRELISYAVSKEQMGGSPNESRFRKSGAYIVVKNTVTWEPTTYVIYGYCWK